MKTIHKRVSSNIRRLLDKKGLTMEQLAIEAEIDTGNLSRVISGKRYPSLALLQKIADALQVDVVELFKDSN
jgi:transcriptional regulator with XRE-family HTH domain